MSGLTQRKKGVEANMAKKENIGYVVAKGGKKYEVIGENGKYWICKNNQFRKANVVFKKRKENE